MLFDRLEKARGLKGFFVFFLLGCLAVLGLAPFYIWPVTLLALALFMIGLDQAAGMDTPDKVGFWRGFAFGTGYFLAGLYWIGSAFLARGPAFIPIMPFAILAMAAGLAVFWGLAGRAYVWVSKDTQSGQNRGVGQGIGPSIGRGVLFAGLMFIAEFLRGHIFSGFPWNLPGYIFAGGGAVSQIAAIVGIYGLSALVLFLAAGLGLVLSDKKNWQFFALSALALVLVWGWGQWRLSQARVENIPGLRLRIVHANIPQKDKFDADKYVENTRKYLALTASPGLEHVSHVIWPEGAVPGLMLTDTGLLSALSQILQSSSDTPPVFVFQTLRVGQGKDGQPIYYNSAGALQFSKQAPPLISGLYDKQKLVPFGEFVPGKAVIGKLGLTSLSTALESLSPGTRPATPSLFGLPPTSMQICYQIIFPGFSEKARPESGEKPELILNLSNDAWYGNSTGPRQQINQARYRAIEEGLAVVRSTSGGISGVIDPYGRQLKSLGIGDEGVIDTPVPQSLAQTSYKIVVNYIILLIIVAMVLVCILVMRR